MKKNLILHIGHGKTGSSYIQSFLALNTELLKIHNINYPLSKNSSIAKDGKITSGNGQDIFNDDFVITGTTLLSNENLFYNLPINNNLENYILNKTDNLTVILYTRNVFELLVSVWGQYIKRGNGTLDINEYLKEENKQHYDLVNWWIESAEKYNFTLKIRNYTHHKKDLIKTFLSDILGRDSNDIFTEIKLPSVGKVNRSLTLAEYKLQQEFNKLIEGSSSYISDILVEENPAIKSEKPYIEESTYDFVKKQVIAPIAKINSNIEADEKVDIEDYNDLDYTFNDGVYTFNEEQLRTLASSISKRTTTTLPEKITNLHQELSYIEKNNIALTEDVQLKLIKLDRKINPYSLSIIKKWIIHVKSWIKSTQNK